MSQWIGGNTRPMTRIANLRRCERVLWRIVAMGPVPQL